MSNFVVIFSNMTWSEAVAGIQRCVQLLTNHSVLAVLIHKIIFKSAFRQIIVF